MVDDRIQHQESRKKQTTHKRIISHAIQEILWLRLKRHLLILAPYAVQMKIFGITSAQNILGVLLQK
jgi:hypothetical protein